MPEYLRNIPALLALLLSLLLLGESRGFCIDDAWIHMAYAKSLRLGDGLSYNPGDWETGASSPLWVALLAILPWPEDPAAAHFPGKLLGAAFFAGTVQLVAKLCIPGAKGTGWSLWAGLAAGCLAAMDPLLLQSSASGMETALAGFLALGCILCCQKSSWKAASALAFAGVLTRPELLFFLGGYSVLRAGLRREPLALTPLFAASTALALWCLYCLAVSGYPFPNTGYVKALGNSMESIRYLDKRLLPGSPWFLGATGALLVACSLVKGEAKLEARTLFIAWGSTAVLICLTRTLNPNILFFHARYFAPIAAIPIVLLGMGMREVGPRIGLALVVPCIAVSAMLLPETAALIQDQEEDIRLLHTEPALSLAEALPKESRVLVEGAGAHRFFLPREMHLIDLIGLNDRTIAHIASRPEILCYLSESRIGFAVLPPRQAAGLEELFQWRHLHRFDEPRYHQTATPFPHSVHLFAIDGVNTPPHCGAEG
jgi:hypothetical protein